MGWSFDSQGDLFFCQKGQNEIFEVPAGTTTPVEYVQNSMLPAAARRLSGRSTWSSTAETSTWPARPTTRFTRCRARIKLKTVPSGNLLSEPNSLAVDPVNNDLYVYNGANGNIIDVPTTTGGTPKTYYTAGTTVYQRSGELAGLAFDPAGNLYVAYYGNNTIWKFAASGSSSLYVGQSFTRTMFHFTDSNSSDTVGQFTAQITLGDGNTFTFNNNGPMGTVPPAGASGQIVKDAERRFRRPAFLHHPATRRAPFSVTVTGPEVERRPA